MSPKSYLDDVRDRDQLEQWTIHEASIDEIPLKLTLILKARLNPDAKNPPNGPITELKKLIDSECSKNG